MSKAYDMIAQERRAQDAQWGGPAHDDTHDVCDWNSFIRYQLRQIDHSEGEADNPKHFQERFAKIAALCVSAIDSLERKFP